MRNRWIAGVFWIFAVLAAVCASAPASAQDRPETPQGATPGSTPGTTLNDIVSAVVRIKTFINPDGRSVSNLGREREGSGVLLDESGLILTIGYLMVEAHSAEIITNAGRTLPATVVGYDHETGFGLLRTLEAPRIKPLPIGKSADLKEQDRALVVSFGGPGMVLPVNVVSKRVFAGSWEYLVPEALFTAPPHPAWSGSALVNREGKLIGVGSLIVGDASGRKDNTPGNMFVPIDLLMPILGDLLADGRVSGPGKPWLGVAAEELAGELRVSRVTPESPAEKAGIKRGDVVIGVGGDVTPTLPEFYKKLWSTGNAGVTVPLDVKQSGSTRRIDVPSVNRLDHLKLRSTF
jgi:S1-C subfamily serine protease